MRRVEVLNEHEGKTRIGRQMLEKGSKGTQASGRCADRDDWTTSKRGGAARRSIIGRRAGRRPQCSCMSFSPVFHRHQLFPGDSKVRWCGWGRLSPEELHHPSVKGRALVESIPIDRVANSEKLPRTIPVPERRDRDAQQLRRVADGQVPGLPIGFLQRRRDTRRWGLNCHRLRPHPVLRGEACQTLPKPVKGPRGTFLLPRSAASQGAFARWCSLAPPALITFRSTPPWPLADFVATTFTSITADSTRRMARSSALRRVSAAAWSSSRT